MFKVFYLFLENCDLGKWLKIKGYVNIVLFIRILKVNVGNRWNIL